MENVEINIEQDGPGAAPKITTADGQELKAISLSWEYDPDARVGLAQIELPPQSVRVRAMAEFTIPGEDALLGAVEFALDALANNEPGRLESGPPRPPPPRRLLAGGLAEYRGDDAPNVERRGG